VNGRTRILITNDDGIESPGVRALVDVLRQEYELVVVTPSGDMSGSGTGIGRFDPNLGVALQEIDLPGVEAYSVDGPPGLAVMGAALGAFGDFPSLVVSGINAGINTGHSVIHSGTVGAALTARTFGARGLAVSLAQSQPWHWETAATVARAAVDWMLADPHRPKVLNVNVPGLPLEEVEGIHWADLDEFGYFRVANARIPDHKLQFQVGPDSSRSDPSTDTYLLEKNLVTVTPLSAVEPTAFPDVPATDIWSPEDI
jgi:5'-nucleotidase